MAPVPVTKFSLAQFDSNVCLNCSVKFMNDGEIETQRINFLEVLNEEKEAVSVWSAINTIFKIPINRQINEEEGIPFGCCPACAKLLDSLYELHRQLDRVRNLDSVVSKIVDRNQQVISAALKRRTVEHTNNADDQIEPLERSPEEPDKEPLHTSPEDIIPGKSASGPNVSVTPASVEISSESHCQNCCVEIQLISDVSQRPGRSVNSVKAGVGEVTIASNKIEIPDILNNILKLPPRNNLTADLKMCVDCARILIHLHMYSSNLEGVANPESRLNSIYQEIREFRAPSFNASSSSSGFPSLPGTQPSKNAIVPVAKVISKTNDQIANSNKPNVDTMHKETMESGDSQLLENPRLNLPVRNDQSIADRDRASTSSTTNIPAIPTQTDDTNTEKAIRTPKVTTQKNGPKPNGTGPKSRNSVSKFSEDPGPSGFPTEMTVKKSAVEQKIFGNDNEDDLGLHNRSGLRSQIKPIPLPNSNDSSEDQHQHKRVLRKRRAAASENTTGISGRASHDITLGPSPPRRSEASVSVGHVTPAKRRATSAVGDASPSPADRRAPSDTSDVLPSPAKRRPPSLSTSSARNHPGPSVASGMSTTKRRGLSAAAPRLRERHFPTPLPDKTRRRCHLCYHFKSPRQNTRTQFQCIPCGKALCVKQCFEHYHTKEDLCIAE